MVFLVMKTFILYSLLNPNAFTTSTMIIQFGKDTLDGIGIGVGRASSVVGYACASKLRDRNLCLPSQQGRHLTHVLVLN